VLRKGVARDEKTATGIINRVWPLYKTWPI
jgi:hypothetical protein